MTADVEGLNKLYVQFEALRIKALNMGHSALDEILLTVLLEIERRLNDLTGSEAFTAPRLRH